VLLVLGFAGCTRALRRVQIVAIAHYFCLVQAAAAVGFVRGLSGRQSVLWKRFERLPSHTQSGRARPSQAAPVVYSHE
jgi:hypothetical protein